MTTYNHVLDALGDPTRRKIFERLRAGPSPVGDLVVGLGISQPAVSQHLKVLREAELVDFEKHGNRRVYRITSAGVDALRSYLESFWDDVLGAFERSTRKRRS